MLLRGLVAAVRDFDDWQKKWKPYEDLGERALDEIPPKEASKLEEIRDLVDNNTDREQLKEILKRLQEEECSRLE